VSVALVIRQALRMRRISLPDYGIFPNHLINGKIFGEKILKKYWYFHFPYNYCLKHFSLEEKLSQI
jgi:hypothetical protein